jgi:uncharacterized protein (TIGR02231 family)
MQVAQGTGSVVFGGLTEDLEEDSIRAWAETADGVSVTGVILDEVHLAALVGDSERRATAEVSQDSGEDWNDVELVLSTADPTRDASLPSLSSRYLDFAAPERPAFAEEVVVKRSSNSYEVDGMNSTNGSPGLVSVASEYRVAAAQSIPSDGSLRRIAVVGHRLAATTSRTVVPSREPSAFLTAKATYRGELPLIGGPLASFVDGAYVGSGFLRRVRTGGDTDLVFGVDQQILVTIVDLADRKGTTAIFGKRRTSAEAYEVRVLKRRSKAVEVTVLDVLPISQEEDISVELDRDSTPPTARDVNDTPGLLAWTRKPDTGEQLVVRFAYTVSYPKDRVVSGIGP